MMHGIKQQTYFCPLIHIINQLIAMKLLLFATLLLCFFSSIAQETTLTTTTNAKTIYAELGGPGLASFNFDMRFQQRNDGLGFRVGAGGFKIDDVGVVFVPVGLNYLLGKSGKITLNLEVGQPM